MLIRHACGHEREWKDDMTGLDVGIIGSMDCAQCRARLHARRSEIATQVACALAERYVYGSPAHLDQWAATAVKMADRLIEELEKPR